MTFDATFSSHIYSLPFVGILLSISLGPILFQNIWHKNYFRFAIFWSLISLTMLMGKFGFRVTLQEWIHMLFHEYIPFMLMIAALYTITGGIHIVIRVRAHAGTNGLLLLVGSFLASFIGTTGAAMLLIRPLLDMNRHRKYRIHLVIFFIFLVANVGGSLTPLGDPPLFLGYLQGIPFWWPMEHLFGPMVKVLILLIAIFLAIDHYLLTKEEKQPKVRETGQRLLHIMGMRNFPILLSVVMSVWMLGEWTDAPSSGILELTWAEIIRNILLLGFALISWKITPKMVRYYNQYCWEPFKEVARLFIGIFTTIIPVIQMLHQGITGPFGGLLQLANPGGQPDSKLYFWLTGWLSAFLDNAPTYLVFFHMAGGDAQVLSTSMAPTLMAISAGAVFMGAMTYIGNAPNFMVKAIAEKQHIKMPSFFGYMLWSCAILLPAFIIFCWIFL
ncbi:sodium:proton antiporter [Candidatus Odyssella acanthamoebae]|uniref:sodium:proton antiporter n=1 Tax=Candidatus Odyssella acanthamoebae TaxID=91604 RepID=UPI00068B7023|nr:sodium:proton antiporter [Candidatus Paracaedibacter acanthamoebae]